MTLPSLLMSLVSIYFDYRFLTRTLGAKHSPVFTLAMMLILGELFGQANVAFSIAGTILGNVLYACTGFFILNKFLFHGSIAKVSFYTVLLQCGPEIGVCMLLPINYAVENNFPLQLTILNITSYVIILLKGALLEYAGRRLQNLRQDLPAGYPFYLLLTFFVSATAFIIMDLFLYSSGEHMFIGSLYGSLFAAAGTAVLILVVVSIDRQLSLRLAEQRAILQAAHYQRREEDRQETVRLRHDMKNHLLCLDGLLREGKSGQALAYTETLVQVVERLSERIATGNDFVDAIINEKRAEALSRGIAFTADMALPADCPVTPPDLCCIFSNALDNAIEASGRAEGARWIEARAFVRQGQLVAEVKNAYAPDGRRRTPGRGYGLENIRRAVEKYGGVMETSAGEAFTFSAMIPL